MQNNLVKIRTINLYKAHVALEYKLYAETPSRRLAIVHALINHGDDGGGAPPTAMICSICL